MTHRWLITIITVLTVICYSNVAYTQDIAALEPYVLGYADIEGELHYTFDVGIQQEVKNGEGTVAEYIVTGYYGYYEPEQQNWHEVVFNKKEVWS